MALVFEAERSRDGYQLSKDFEVNALGFGPTVHISILLENAMEKCMGVLAT